MRKKIIPLLIVAILIPQVAFAAWWNPFSWKIFTRIFNTKTETAQTATTTDNESDSDNEIEKLLKKVEELEEKVNKQGGGGSSNASQKITPVSNQATKSVTPASTQSSGLSNSQLVGLVSPSVVFIKTPQGSGSGVVIEGIYILTNAHVVGNNSEVEITLNNGKRIYGTLWGVDEDADLALLKPSYTNLQYLRVGNSSNISQGDNVYAFGFPLSSTLEYIGANAEEVSFKEGTLSRRTTLSDIKYLEMSAEIHPGNSGGPLVDSTGSVIGINTVAIGSQPGERIKWAIDIDYAKPLIQYMKEGRQLWKAKNSNEDERLVDRELTKVYNNLIDNESIITATQSSYDQSLFSYFNSNLYKNDNSIKKSYLERLINGLDKNILALEAIRDINRNLHNDFLVGNKPVFDRLPNIYQQKIMRELTVYSSGKIREHSDKFTEWFAVKMQYEDLLKNTSQVESSYLLSQEKYLLSAVKYIESERDTLINFSSNRRLF